MVKMAGLVIVYNPNIELPLNVRTYIDFVDVLYIVDNSEGPTIPTVLALTKESNKIHYVKNKGNEGIASGLNLGGKLAQSNGYNWLLTMDQDTSFNDHRFFDDFYGFNGKDKVAIFSPNHYAVKNSSTVNSNYREVLVTMTSANLLNLEIFQKLGGFLDKLFIDQVDHEYCLRANTYNYKVIVFDQTSINHNLGVKTEVRYKKKIKDVVLHSSNRLYYISRNTLFVAKSYFKFYPVFSIRLLYYLFEILYRNYFNSTERKTVLKAILLGFTDFKRNRYGKLIEKF